jgi:glutathionylspermidine synthase
VQSSATVLSRSDTQPLKVAARLPKSLFTEVRQKAIFECSKWDVQCGDHCVLADFPIVISTSAWRSLSQWSAAMHQELLGVERELLERPDLQRELGLPRSVVRALSSKDNNGERSSGFARVMRFDFHWTSQGWRVSEVNADVPGGFIESGGFTRFFAEFQREAVPTGDPALAYAKCIRSSLDVGAVVGLVHATVHSDDHQVMKYLSKIFHQVGLKCSMVSPDNLTWTNGQAKLDCRFDSGHVDAIIRFFPAEWLPFSASDHNWAPYFCGCKTPLSNPGSALLIQSKRLPLFWEKLNCVTTTLQTMFPESKEIREIHRAELGDWVLKAALGRVGENVAIEGVSSESEWRRIFLEAQKNPGNWVAQRRFFIEPLDTEYGPQYPCIGVFTIDGHAAGAYGRISPFPLINDSARDIAVLAPSGKGEN